MVLCPTPGQLAWQRDRFGVFFHVGVNTFHGVEWSDGSLPAASFDPVDLDADQWVRAAAEAGARYVVLTAKHHDGFCLWPTATTDYSVASSPWRDGGGDLVAEVAAACRRHGVKLGLYLSPWDRHAPSYDDPPAYDDYYVAQLTELCTRYGELSELWFDGAGSQGRDYDWKRIADVIARLQPAAMVFNLGRPTIRWVGNEDGLAADPVEYVVDRVDFSQYTVETTDLVEALYLPPECDVSLRRGWFWSPDDAPKSLEHLLAIHYRSIGMGANLLLNLPPDATGRLPAGDVARLREYAAERDRRFAHPIPAELEAHGAGHVTLDFGREVDFDHLVLEEHLDDGQRITAHEVRNGGGVIASGLTVGARRIHVGAERRARRLDVRLTGDGARLAGAVAYATGVTSIPDPAYLASTDEPG